MTIYLAMYKGPGTKIHHKIFHYGTCLFTLSRYSHCELIIDNVAYSSSARDDGVRKKVIPDINSSEKWDIFELPAYFDAEFALRKFSELEGKSYDYLGVAKFVFPFIRNHRDKHYCSEVCSLMLNLPKTEYSPEDLFRVLVVDTIRQYVPQVRKNEENPF